MNTTTTKMTPIEKAQMAAEKAAVKAAKAGEKAAALLEKAIARELARAEKATAAEAAKAEKEATKAAVKAQKEAAAEAEKVARAAAFAAKAAEKKAEKAGELKLIGGDVYYVTNGNVYEYGLEGELGDYVGRLTAYGAIDGDAAEETAKTAARQARTAAKKAERMAAKMAAAKGEADARDALRLEYYQMGARLDAMDTALTKMQEEMALLRRRQTSLWDEISAVSV
jgi:hypothetical protein